jgi:ABC-type transporter MlaC component
MTTLDTTCPPAYGLFGGLRLMLPVLILFTVPVAAAAPETNAKALIERNYTKIKQVVARVTKQKQLSAEITSVLDNMVHWPKFSRKTLTSRIWDGLKPAERTRFIDAYRQLIVRKYAKRFKPKTSFRVTFRGKVKVVAKDRALVKTTLFSKREGRPVGVDVDYVCQKVKAGWRVADIVTDGVSRAQTYRPKFKRIFEKRGLGGLIKAILRNVNKK